MLTSAPVLSTPDSHILGSLDPVILSSTPSEPHGEFSTDEELATRYEIERTVREIKDHQWRRVALQFPDEMLRDSARVFMLLARGCREEKRKVAEEEVGRRVGVGRDGMDLRTEPDEEKGDGVARGKEGIGEGEERNLEVKLTILADTSYGSCCIDEIAAEHVEADVVVHYGRACLSPTARLPVIHVFTKQRLDRDRVAESFRRTFPDRATKVVLTADMPYADHVLPIIKELETDGYVNVFAASIVHDPASPIPNRTVPLSIEKDPASLSEWQVFHLSEPPTSLLLSLSSRVDKVYIYPTSSSSSARPAESLLASSAAILRRRYALVTSLTTVSIWGILINTLSVKNYLHIVDHVKSQIAAAGKKSYMVVVGKLNPAKVANFSEIGGWVVIGCWESSLVDSKEFYRPVITPFELELALRPDDERMWTGEWRGDFQHVLDGVEKNSNGHGHEREDIDGDDQTRDLEKSGEYTSDEESAPPEYDLRTGRLVSHSRPMGAQQPIHNRSGISSTRMSSTALARRAKGDMVAVNGIASPAAEFLKSTRTWQGLGSDFEIKYEEDDEEEQPQGSAIEEGRTGIASGYTVGESAKS